MGKILTVDIGNSNIVVGAWDGDALTSTFRIQTRRDYSVKELLEAFTENGVCGVECAYEGAILSSVVPEINDVCLDALKEITGKRPLLMGPLLDTGIDLSKYEPGSIGMDRIVDVTAAATMYGAPVLVCDLGTCTTITVADLGDAHHKGRIIGGMICPGVQLSLNAEAEHTSQLPKLRASEVKELLGKDTSSNMMSGAVAGCGLMLSELAKRLLSEMPDLKVVVTGGLGKLVIPWIKCEAEVHYEPDLLLRGLRDIFVANN
ncbi:MAG: type III pantothenate kinase [Butyrivibrio sp.]|nr:type III pantothenate kinase [Butyrivibrio sp.]